MRKLICFLGKIIFAGAKKNNLCVESPKKILVFKIGALGDVLMTTPVLRNLRKTFPKAEITYLVGSFCDIRRVDDTSSEWCRLSKATHIKQHADEFDLTSASRGA